MVVGADYTWNNKYDRNPSPPTAPHLYGMDCGRWIKNSNFLNEKKKNPDHIPNLFISLSLTCPESGAKEHEDEMKKIPSQTLILKRKPSTSYCVLYCLSSLTFWCQCQGERERSGKMRDIVSFYGLIHIWLFGHWQSIEGSKTIYFSFRQSVHARPWRPPMP